MSNRADRVRDTATGTGTSTLTFANAAPTGKRTPVDVWGTGVYNIDYCAEMGAEWEIGRGSFNGTTLVLTRTTIYASSNAGAAVNFSAGTKDIFIGITANQIVDTDQAQTISGAKTFSNNVTISGAKGLRGCYGSGGITSNLSIGDLALVSNTFGSANTAVGYAALRFNTNTSYNTAVGTGALTNSVGNHNLGVGQDTLGSNTTGTYNTAVGNEALYSNTTGAFNTVFGHYSLRSNTGGTNNVAIGYSAGRYETGSNAFYIDNQNRTNTAGDKAKALLYGKFATAAVDQELTVNASLKVQAFATNLITNTGATYTQLKSDQTIIQTTAASVYTLLNAATYPGREIHIATQFAGTVTSASSNVVPQAGGAAGTAILPATAGAYATLKSDGTNWVIIDSGGGAGGSGDVTAASAFGTDNRLVRSDGTGKGVQGSAISVDDTGNLALSGAGALRGSYGAGSVTSNFAAGDSALAVNGTGASNVAVGNLALTSNTSGGNNTALGYAALYSNTTGLRNTAIGYGAVLSTSIGTDNVGVGYQVLNASTGSTNTAIGSQVLIGAVSGNVAIGYSAGRYETGSNAFYVNNQDRTNTANDKTLSILYGVMSATTANQSLTANVKTFSVAGTDARINLTGITTEPSASPTDTLHFYAKKIAGRMVPKTIGPTGSDVPLQNAVWQTMITEWTQNNATAGVWKNTVGASAGTFTTALPTTTSLYTSQKRARYANVVTTTNQVLGLCNTEAQFFAGNTAGQGGFFFHTRCGFDVWTNAGRFFAGMATGTTVISAEPSALNNTVGFCIDAADATGAISFLTRSTSATKASTGFSAATGKGYDLYIYLPPNSSSYGWRIVDINAGTEASGTATATPPAVNTMLTANVLASNAALTPVTSIQLGISKIYVETER